MANSPLLQIPLLSTSQAAKEDTINSMVAYLERAMTDAVDLNLAEGNLTLPEIDFFRYMYFRLRNVGADSTLTIPASKRMFVIDNRGNGFPIRIASTAAQRIIEPDAVAILHSTETHLTVVSNSAWTGFNDDAPNEEPSGRHTYWRVLFKSGSHLGYVQVAEMRMSDVPGGASLTTGGVPLSGGDVNASFSRQNAFDGNMGSYWHSSDQGLANNTTYLGYQFQEPVAINYVEIAIAAANTYRPYSGIIQWSDDGSAWFDAWTFESWAWGTGAEAKDTVHPNYAFEFNALTKLNDVDALSQKPIDGDVVTWDEVLKKWVPRAVSRGPARRYWRLFVTEFNNAEWVSISELNFRSKSGASEDHTGRAFFFSSEHQNFPARNAFDGNPATYFGEFGAQRTQKWVGIDFMRSQPVEEVYLRPASAAQAPRTFAIQCSNDNVTWTTVKAVANMQVADWEAQGLDLVIPLFSESSGGAGLADAPVDGKMYARKDGVWAEVVNTGGGETPGNPDNPGNSLPTAHRYWRVTTRNTAGNATNRFIRIDEIEFATTKGGGDMTDPALASQRAFSSIGSPANAFNGLTSHWDSGPGGMPKSIGWDFVDPIRILEARILTKASEGNSLTEVAVEYSDDNVAWTTAWVWEGSSTHGEPFAVRHPLLDLVGGGPGDGGGGFEDAPSDGKQYARKDGEWVEVESPVIPVLSAFLGGTLDASETLFRFIAPQRLTLPTGNIRANAAVAASDQVVIDIRTNGVTVGTITFAPAGLIGTVALAVDVILNAGDVLSLHAPATSDATLADVAITMKGA